MALENIIQKERVLDTPGAMNLKESPGKWKERFLFHVRTHVSIADLTSKWEGILKNLNRGISATGLVYADTGYGKTSTAIALWNYAENQGVVAVPPFSWHSIADMLIATHGWVCYRLNSTRPDLIPRLEEKYTSLMESSDEDLARRMAHDSDIPLDHARKSIQVMKAEGRLSNSVSSNRLIDYLRFATTTLLEATYKGLLILADEFRLFEKTNPDISKNIAELKDFIFTIFQTNDLPIGCVVFTFGTTRADIQLRAQDIFARFDKPEGSLINLEQAYGKIENGRTFAHDLWDKLAVLSDLTEEERDAISDDILTSLGQFLRHKRTTQLISGPRSVVATLRQAAIHYSETKTPYSIFDFCSDYLDSGKICFNQQEIDAARAYTAIMSQPIIGDSETRRKIVKLLSVFPDGVPPDIFRKHEISDTDRTEVVQGLLGQHVITKIIGPTLVHYRDDLHAGDQLIEILKVLRSNYNPGSPEIRLPAVRSFANYVLPEIFKQSVAASATGWTGLRKLEGGTDPIFQLNLSGTSIREYPRRTLTVHIGGDGFEGIDRRYRESQLFTSFVLRTEANVENRCLVKENGMFFQFNIQRPIDPNEVPTALNKLGDLFLPEAITPSLLLSMLDFFDLDVTQSQIRELKQEAQVEMLRAQIRDQLISYFFSADVKNTVVSSEPELQRVPAGKDFVERSLTVLVRKRFPLYRAVAISNQWKRNLVIYTQYLKEVQSLGVKQGIEPVKMISADVPKQMFNVQSHISFRQTYHPNGVWRDLLRVNLLDENDNVVEENIELPSSQRRVAIYFIRHNLEQRIVDQLDKTKETVSIDGKEAKALRLNRIYMQEKETGYLDDEIEQLIQVLEARGLVDRKSHQGINYLYRVETEINFVELKNKLEFLVALESLAKSKGFTPEWEPGNSLESVQADAQPITGIEFDEVRKDALRQKLNSIENRFNIQCTTWLQTERLRVDRKRGEIEPLRLETPKVLDETTGHPTTDFSMLLFHGIRNEVKSAYTSISQQVSTLKNDVEEALRKKLSEYLTEKTPEKAIEAASDLRDSIRVIDAKITTLREKRAEAEVLYGLFEKWRNVARQVERDHLTMTDAQESDVVKNLINRLDEEQRIIKQHLADRAKTVKQVLENHEHFANRIAAIKTEFDQIALNRQDDFNRFRAQIEEQLRKVIDQPGFREQYNPTDDEGSYRRVREQAVEKVQNFVIDPAMRSIQAIKGDLMKATEVFKVSDDVKNKAIALREQVLGLERRIDQIRNDLKPEGIEARLPELVIAVQSIHDEGAEVIEKREWIQHQLRSKESELSGRAKKLLSLIDANGEKDFTELTIELRQSSDEMFRDTAAIIESLEELYQRNWLNIKVSRTTGQ